MWIALAIASYVSLVMQTFPTSELNFGEGYEVVAVARNLALEGDFANPFHTLRTGPTAHVSRIYPLYLAAIFRVMGYSSAGLSTVVAGLMAMHVLYPLLLFATSRKLFRSGRLGSGRRFDTLAYIPANDRRVRIWRERDAYLLPGYDRLAKGGQD